MFALAFRPVPRYFHLLIFVFAATVCSAKSGEAQDAHDLPEYVMRSGLRNTAARIQTGLPVRVAYLGGSITAAEGWRPLSLKWLQKQYPAVAFTDINAAIAGTDSTLGAFRLHHDVLLQRPNLVFVEFAVNDKDDDPTMIKASMEGIIRQIWTFDANIDICFVYTLNSQDLPDLKKRILPPPVKLMEQIADQYGVPSIDFSISVSRYIEQGKMLFQGPHSRSGLDGSTPSLPVFSSDGTHPYADTGHLLYLNSFGEAIHYFLSHARESPMMSPHTLPSRRSSFILDQAKEIPLNATTKTGEWTRASIQDDSGAIARSMPEIWVADKAASNLEFSFKGTMCGLFGIKGPDNGNFTVDIDGKPIITTLFDPYSTIGHFRLRAWTSPILSDGIHHVKVSVTGTSPDKRRILFDASSIPRDSKELMGTSVYVGYVLLNGELRPPPSDPSDAQKP